MEEQKKAEKSIHPKAKALEPRLDLVVELQPPHYKVERKLSSSLCLIRDESDGKLKVLRHLCLGDHSENIHQAVQAAKDVSLKLCHPYLVGVEKISCEPSTVRVLSEYCEGGSLCSLIGRARKYGESLNEIEVMDWFVQLVLALQHLHQQDIIHGCLSPSAIYLKNNAVKVSEPRKLKELFRECVQKTRKSSKISSEDEDTEHPLGNVVTVVTSTEDLRESLPYMSPEALEGKELTTGADMWSLGCILFEMCAGKSLFKGGNEAKLISNIRGIQLQRFPLEYNSNLKNVWKRLLASDPSQRPTANQLLQVSLIAEHWKDMEDSIAQQRQKLARHPPEGSYDVTAPIPHTFDDEVDVDEDAILTLEDALQLLEP